MDGTVKHRSVKEALNIREVQLLILELKSRGAYWTGKDAKISWETLEFLVWKYFRIILSDLVYWTKKDFETKCRSTRGRIIPNTIVVNILKKLGVKCPYVKCGEDFSNRIPAHMSGIHMDHRDEKDKEIGRAMGYYIDVLIDELVNGDCDPTCCFCHDSKRPGIRNLEE